jgi:5-methylthioadenosine/S-adenosylhomocysteine deaminase
MTPMNGMILIKAGYVVTNPLLREKGVIENGAVCIQGKRIMDVGPWVKIREQYPQAEIIGSDDTLVLPGFIDLHNHGQGVSTFSQGLTDNPLELWAVSWPRLIEKPFELSHWDSLVSASKQIRSGVTTTMPKRMDQPPRPLPEYEAEVDRVLAAYELSGMRVFFAIGTTDKASQFVYIDNDGFIAALPDEERAMALELSGPGNRITLEQYLSMMEGLCCRHLGNSRVNIALAITGPQWLSDAYLVPLVETAMRLGMPIHGPMLESPYQKMYAERMLGKTAFEHFGELGFLGTHTSFAHCVWVTERDIDILAKTGATVVHCPSSNLRFYDGISPVGAMLEKGIQVALAVDSEGMNDDDDTFLEMRLALLLHRLPGAGRSPDEWDLLSMATINGARALKMEQEIGTLDKGKLADVVLVRLERILKEYVHPSIHPVVSFVRRGRPIDIERVMVEGETLYEDGTFTRFNEEDAYGNLNRILRTMEWTPSLERAGRVSRLLPHIRAYYDKWHLKEQPFYLCNGRS